MLDVKKTDFPEIIKKAWEALQQDDIATAMQHAKQAADISPDAAEVSHLLGVLANYDGRTDLALPLLQKAVSAAPTERNMRDMAIALLADNQAELALKVLKDAVAMFGATANLLGLKAAVYIACNQLLEAKQAISHAIENSPNSLVWHSTLGFCELMLGNTQKGLEVLTARSANFVSGSRSPVLNLNQPCELWLKNEDGPGDTIFNLRGARLLSENGFKLNIQTDRKTRVLLRDTGLFNQVKEEFNCPANTFWFSMGDLPLATAHLSSQAIHAPLTLLPDPTRVRKMRDKLASIGTAPYIGVTWRAGPRGKKIRAGARVFQKQIDPQLLGQALQKTQATVISLQRLPEIAEAQAFKQGLGRDFADLSILNDNLQDMLALLSLLNTYITVPNTNLHLRESLSLSSHVFVNYPNQDWRWGMEGDSPWYPSSQVYRQNSNLEWDAALQQLDQALNKFEPSNNTTSAEQPIINTQAAQQETFFQTLQVGWEAVESADIAGGIKAAQSVLAEHPDHTGALHLLGWSAYRDRKVEFAIELLQRAYTLSPDSGHILGDLVRVLAAGKHPDKALELANAAIADQDIKQKTAIYYARAALHLQQNRTAEGIQDYDKCMTLSPNFIDAMGFNGMARLKMGDARTGFRYYSARLESKHPSRMEGHVCPWLRGNLTGLRVLIKRDMGLGDELSYLRYLPWLTQAGVQVTYWAGAKLAPILSRMGYANQILSDQVELPTANHFDLSFWVHETPVAVEALGAPEIAPPLPLTPRPDLVEKWKAWLAQFGPAPYIGINWKAGAAANGVAKIFSKLSKAADATSFAACLAPVNATFISLQRNIMLEEIKSFEQMLGAPLHDVASMTDDLEDLLALLSILDENVGVSNTNMHLRAGLGLPSRVLVQSPGSDWRWGTEGTCSIWFNDCKVYRQQADESWDAAMQCLQNDLLQKHGQRVSSVKENIKQNTLSFNSKRLIWLTAGRIEQVGNQITSNIASARYRVIIPSQHLDAHGWKSEIVNEGISEAMGGWGAVVPKQGDTVIVSKVFTQHAVQLVTDAKQRGARIVVDVSDNFFAIEKRGELLRKLCDLADSISTPTPGMADVISQETGKIATVIFDPLESAYKEASFHTHQPLRLMWYGHRNNYRALLNIYAELAEFAKNQPIELTLVTDLIDATLEHWHQVEIANVTKRYVTWQPNIMQQEFDRCDLVVLPVKDDEFGSVKSANRLTEAMYAGKFVVAQPLPTYLNFAEYAWVKPSILEGVSWALAHPQEVIKKIQQGQRYIEQQHSAEAVALQWHALLSQQEISALTSVSVEPDEFFRFFDRTEAAKILNLASSDSNTLNLWEKKYPIAYPNTQAKKIAVFTAIFGGYDTPPIIENIDPNIDYWLFSDQNKQMVPAPWKVRLLANVFDDTQLDARRVKILSHLFLPDYDATVWIDGNFTLNALSATYVNSVIRRAPVAVCKHQFRACIYDEAMEVLKREIDASTPVMSQVRYYQSRIFPRDYGLHATGFLIRNQQDVDTIKFNMRWWELVAKHSKRDQLSFDYVRWETKVYVMPLPFNQRQNKLFNWGKYGSKAHASNIRRHDEHVTRAFHSQASSKLISQQYDASVESWSKRFLLELTQFNAFIDTEHNVPPSSLLYFANTFHPAAIPDPRKGHIQQMLMAAIAESRQILLLSADVGHNALLMLQYSGANVTSNELDTEAQHTGSSWLLKQYPKRYQVSAQDMHALPEQFLQGFDTVFVQLSTNYKLDKLSQLIDGCKAGTKVLVSSEDIDSTELCKSLFEKGKIHYFNQLASPSFNALITIERKVSGFTKSSYGVWLKQRKNDLTWKFAMEGKYGDFYSTWLQKREECNFIDIGANIGLYSLIAATNPNIKEIAAFEPHPDTYEYLCENIAHNQAHNCKALKLAISDQTQRKLIHTKNAHSGTATLRTVSEEDGFVDAVSIDCIDAVEMSKIVVFKNNLPISIKIDVEGHELVVIQTLIKTDFWSRVSEIYYEVNEDYLPYQEILQLLNHHGFTVTHKNGNGVHYDLLVSR